MQLITQVEVRYHPGAFGNLFTNVRGETDPERADAR